jgi:YVTN family beta-propeller protein
MKNYRQLAVVLVAILATGGIAQAQAPRPGLVVVSKGENALKIVDPKTLMVVGQVGVGVMPHEVALSSDGKLALVTNYGPKMAGTSLSLVDVDAMKEIQRVPLLNLKGPQGEAFGDLIGPHGVAFFDGQFYFTAEGSQKIGRYDPSKNRIDWVQEIGQERTHMLAIDKKTHTIYTANVKSGTVTAVEPSRDGGHWTNTVIPTGKGDEGIDISPDGKEVWAANSGDGTVTVIDTSAKKAVATVDVGTKHSNRLKFTPDGKLVLISDIANGDLVVVDTASRKVAKRINLGKSAEGILIVPDGSRVFVAVSSEDKLVVLDPKTFAVIGEVVGMKDADGMAWRQ